MSKLHQRDDGYWFYPVKDFVYDKAYFDKYKQYTQTKSGELLLQTRLNIIKSYTKLLDIGVGSGHLIDSKVNAKGFDVNPYTVKKLQTENRWFDPYNSNVNQFDVITFFDSFEHIESPNILLSKIISPTIVIAIPIFTDYNNLLQSKHYRQDEHFHYFTFLGFLKYMKYQGFICQYISDGEIKAGRESVWTFVFRRY